MTAHLAEPWVIDDRSTYEGQHGLGCKPLALGAVVAECPTSFGSHVVRDRATIGKPCPTVAEGDAMGLAHAHLCKAAPDLLRELKRLVRANEEWNADVQQVIGRMPTWTDGYLDDARAAIASAEGAKSDDDVIHLREEEEAPPPHHRSIRSNKTDRDQ